MPVTINTMVSKLDIMDLNSISTPEKLDQIVRLVTAQVLEQLRAQEESRQIGHIPERNSNVDTYA